MIKLLDPITQAIIYYRQGDMESFENFTKTQKFLALFLLGKTNLIEKYLPSDHAPRYRSFIDMLQGKSISKLLINKMLGEMAKEGSLQGVKFLQSKGADIRTENDAVLILASWGEHLEVVKYMVKHGADIRVHNYYVLIPASENGHLKVVKYLVEQGANIHTMDDYALRCASQNGHLDVVEFLVEQGATMT